MQVALEPAQQPDVLALIEALDAYQRPLYPAESHHGIDLAALSEPNVLFAVARDEDGRAVGCGAIVRTGARGELKRMYTDPSQRGRGVASDLLRMLESEARRAGCVEFVLETGYLQTAAISLYKRHGYAVCGPFGDYVDDPNSVFMCKGPGGARAGLKLGLPWPELARQDTASQGLALERLVALTSVGPPART